MAQQKKKTSSKSGSGAKKQPTSTARTPSTTKKASSSNTRKSTNTSKSSGTKTAASKNQTSRSASNIAPRRPIRRQVGCFGLLFLGLVAFISYFPGDGWLVEAMRTLLRGLSGWGFYLAPFALFGGSAILGFHRGRPVRARVTCALLLPVLFGAFIHIISCSRDGLFAPGFGYGVRQLWLLAQDTTEHCGGVLGGILAIVLRKSISTVGGVLVLVVAFALMAIEALNLSVVELIDQYRARPKLEYELEEPEEDDSFSPEDYLFPLNGGKPIRKKDPKAKAPARPAVTAPETGKAVQTPPRRRMYDEDWERDKDKLFAAMDVDPGAAMRVAAALAEEQALAQEKRLRKPKSPPRQSPHQKSRPRPR
jgi:S-DNA-T family DNA segregation ATPase FtsK/SpoIIIE